MTSMFRGIIEFFERLGIYDVILPFLLVFSITFAILEKTKIFGEIEVNGEKFTRKSYNSIIAFCLGFMVVASTRMVAIINEGVARVAVIIVTFVSFMIAIGVFYGEGDNIFGDDGIKKLRPALISLTLITMAFITLSVIETEAGNSWLEVIFGFIVQNWDSNLVGSVVLLIFLVGFMRWISKPPVPAAGNGGDS